MCSLYLERVVLDVLLLPPFSAHTVWSAIGTGLGIPILYQFFDSEAVLYQGGNFNFRPACLIIQIAYLATFPIAWTAYWIGGFRRVPENQFEWTAFSSSESSSDKMVVLGWILLAFSISFLIFKVAFGLEDRGVFGPAGHSINSATFTISRLIDVFPRFSQFGFFFLPLVWRKSGRKRRILIFLFTIFYCAFALASGTRAWLVSSSALVVMGMYFFRRNSTRVYEVIITCFCIFGVVVGVLFPVYRSIPKFVNVKTVAASSRIQLFLDREFWAEVYKKQTLRVFGSSLFQNEDAMIYYFTPLRVPYVGFEGFSAIPLTWVPTCVYPKKLDLLDANRIVYQYDKEPGKFQNTLISLNADSYRRWGWIGIPVVVVFYFLLYGYLAGMLLTTWNSGTIWGMLLLCFSVTLFTSKTFKTVLWTWWMFFYDIPKHLLAMGLLCVFVHIVFKCRDISLYRVEPCERPSDQ